MHDTTSTSIGDASTGMPRNGYNAHCGGRYDTDEDQMAREPPRPRVFSRAIRNMPLPNSFRPPSSITKYNGETKTKLWLANFCLACQLGGAR